MLKSYRTEKNTIEPIKILINDSFVNRKYNKTTKEILNTVGKTYVILSYNGDINGLIETEETVIEGNNCYINCIFANKTLIQKLPYDYYRITIVHTDFNNSYVLLENEPLFLYNKELIKINEAESAPILPGEPEDEPDDGPLPPAGEPEDEGDNI